jgi:hypothetical protein
MDVSAETEIYEESVGENGVEIFEKWAGLGVTILGDDVPPAIPGARIKAMSVRDDVEGMKLRAASLLREDSAAPDNEKKKGVKFSMNKRKTALLQKMFSGYTVLGGSEDGMKVCLLNNETMQPAGYVFTDEADKSGVVKERICGMSASTVFKFGEEEIAFDFEQIADGLMAKLVAANSDIQAKDAKIAELEAKVKEQHETEMKRRVSDAKKAVMNRLDALNKGRDERCAYDKKLAEEGCAKCESGCFNECMEGCEWCGDKMAVMELEAACAREQERMDNEKLSKKTMSWNNLVPDPTHNENDTQALLNWVNG